MLSVYFIIFIRRRNIVSIAIWIGGPCRFFTLEDFKNVAGGDEFEQKLLRDF